MAAFNISSFDITFFKQIVPPHPYFFKFNKEYIPAFIYGFEKYANYIRKISEICDVVKFYYELQENIDKTHPLPTPRKLYIIIKQVFDSIVSHHNYLNIKLQNFMLPKYIMNKYHIKAPHMETFRVNRSWTTFLKECNTVPKFLTEVHKIIDYYNENLTKSEKVNFPFMVRQLILYCQVFVAMTHDNILCEILGMKINICDPMTCDQSTRQKTCDTDTSRCKVSRDSSKESNHTEYCANNEESRFRIVVLFQLVVLF